MSSTATVVAPRKVRYVPERFPEAPAPLTAVASPTRSLWSEPFEVLLIEDNDDEIAMVQRTLKRGGLTDRPRVVRDGQAALNVLLGPNFYPERASPIADVPDVIFLDLGLPRISGLNVLRRIKDDPRVCEIPVVVLSGADDEEMAHACMNLGANMYIIKPISYVEVMNVIVAIQKHWLAAENFGRLAAQWRQPTAA